MKTSRERALDIIARIEQDEGYINAILDGELRQKALDPRDKALITECVYGVIRWRRRLDWYLGQVCNKPLNKAHPGLRRILRLGAYQLLFLDRVPASAAINESVKLAARYASRCKLPVKTAKGFVNGVLRQLDRTRDALALPDSIPDPVLRLATNYSYPDWMARRWRKQFGHDTAAALCEANNRPSPLMVRLNPLCSTLAELRDSLCREVETVELLPANLPGFVLHGHPPVANLTCLQEGRCSVQNASAMLMTLLLNPQPGEHILDACAGSGIKTTHIAEQMKNQGRIVAIDRHQNKLQRLQENCRRLGISIVESQCGDMTRLEPITASSDASRQFDRILLDAPCSGLGVLGKHPEAKWTRREQDIAALQHLQGQLLAHCAAFLRPGGTLLYSTCTTEAEENQEVIAQFLQRHPQFYIESLARQIPNELHPFLTADGCLHIVPPQPLFDGFFGARLSYLA